MLSVTGKPFMRSVTNKPFLLSVVKLNVVMLCLVILNVLAPQNIYITSPLISTIFNGSLSGTTLLAPIVRIKVG